MGAGAPATGPHNTSLNGKSSGSPFWHFQHRRRSGNRGPCSSCAGVNQ